MRVRCMKLGAWLSGTLFVLTALSARPSTEPPPGGSANAAEDADKAISDLRQVTSDLNDAVKRFLTDLDREIVLHDRGYRAKNGRRISGADSDFSSGPADVAQMAMRKLFAARMLAARKPGYAPAALADLDRIQSLIMDARGRIAAGNDVMRALLLVSAKDLNPAADAAQKLRLKELVKARTSAAEAAKKALVVLPVALQEADSTEEQREKAWDSMDSGRPFGSNNDDPHGGKAMNLPLAGARQQKAPEDVTGLTAGFEAGKRITLVNQHSLRVMLTDSGSADDQGRRLFYQEEWVRRTASMDLSEGLASVAVSRWAVAVDSTTGQHTLLRRYEPLKFKGEMDELSQLLEGEDAPNLELPERSSAPSMTELTSSISSVDRSREEFHNAFVDFRSKVHDAMMRSNALLVDQDKATLDADMEENLREKLFALRSHFAGTALILDAENKLRGAMEQADGRARELEALVAWLNGNALEREDSAQDSRALLDALNRSDAGVRQTRSLEREARAVLPPVVSAPEAQFPALQDNMIVRMRMLSASAGKTVKCKQEIWQLTTSGSGGAGNVKRTIDIVEIDVKSGNQVQVQREVRHYAAEPGESLEQVFDENAAQ